MGRAAAMQSPGVTIAGPLREDCKEILSPEATEFVAELARHFRDRVLDLLAARAKR